jgi:hypothetical protein
MVTVHLDLPIFSSPTEAFGYFSGEVELESMPRDGEPFPWPKEWLTKFRDVFDEQPTQVWGVSEWPYPPAERHITMYGLVGRDRDQARELARHIEQSSGIDFQEHDRD